MLYDNAQLLSLYSNAYKEFKTPLFKSTVYKTFSFLQEKMKNTDGGYFSSIDADNDEGEGRYYLFNLNEIKKVAGQDLDLILDFYQIELDNPIENSFYHLRRTKDLNTFLKKYSITIDQLDDKQKILGLLCSYEAFDDEQFLVQAKIDANLEDYAFIIRAALSLYQNTGNVIYLEIGNELTQKVIKNFSTNKNPFFTYTRHPVMFSQIISIDDNVIPSANSIMAENLWILGILLDNEDYSSKTSEMLGVVAEYFCDGKGNNYSQWAQLISKVAYSYKEVVIIGPEALKYNKKLQQNYFPNVIFQISDKPSDLPLLKDRYFKGETFIYVCENKVCLRPSETPFEALKQINSL